MPALVSQLDARSADFIATSDHHRALTAELHARLRRAVLGTATGLIRAGLSPGDRLLMRLPDRPLFPVVYLGAIAAGIVPVVQAQWQVVDDFSASSRSTGGFGSTGR